MGIDGVQGRSANALNSLAEYIFIGIVSSYTDEPNTVIVTRPDKDDRTTDKLQVIQHYTQDNKMWRMPAIGEQVLCLLLPNSSGSGPGAGYVLGSFYSEADTPVEDDNKVRSIHYKDGSYIREDGEGNIEIHATGNITITADGDIKIEAKGIIDEDATTIYLN